MTYLLDTNCCIGLIRRMPIVTERLARHSPDEVRLCTVVKAELLFGARKSLRVAENIAGLERFFRTFDSWDFDDRAADEYGLIRADLERMGQRIGQADLMIAAIARANDATLVTHNTREFLRVVGLRVEDWEA